MIGRSIQSEPLAIVGPDALLRHLPLITTVEDVLGYRMDFFRGVFEHDRYDDWWSRYSLRERYGEMDVPAYFMTGWFDSLLHETLTVFSGWKRHARSEETRRLTENPRRTVEPPDRAVGSRADRAERGVRRPRIRCARGRRQHRGAPALV